MNNVLKPIPILIIVALMLPVAGAGNYSNILNPSPFGKTTIAWSVREAPTVPFSYFWIGNEQWLAEPDSIMSFTVNEVSEDVLGQLTLGNTTVTANDTDIARDLTLGIWGITPFLPGLVVEIGELELDELNDTAFASANRVYGNYLNGTIESAYEEVSIRGLPYSCITFSYEQDPSGFGEPQRTYLAYDIHTGVLVEANTTYSFGAPYSLVLELSDILTPLGIAPVILVGVGAVIIATLLVVKSKTK